MQLSMAVKIELNAQTRAGLAEAEAGNEDEHEDADGCVSEQQENLMPLRPEMTTAARSGSGASAA